MPLVITRWFALVDDVKERYIYIYIYIYIYRSYIRTIKYIIVNGKKSIDMFKNRTSTLSVQSSSLAITADNFLYSVYIEGVKQTNPSNCNDWKSTKLFPLPPGARQVAISCGDDGISSAGVLASVGAVQITDAAWKCTSHYFYKWTSADFDDSSWPWATVIGNNGMDPWVSRPDISANANWIWTFKNVNPGADTLVYCRSTRKLQF